MSLENKYFAELARRLRAAGITTGHPEKNRLTVLLNDQPVLSVSAGSDVFLLPAGSNQPEASELYHKVAQTADEVYAYRHLLDQEKCDKTEQRFGPIRGRYVLYRGEDVALENGVHYRNVERYLNDLPELNIAPAQEAGIEQTGPVL